ncbi:MAG TPA: YceI family protein [Pseudomonadales bacterium]
MQSKALNAGMAALLLSGAAQADWTLDAANSRFHYVTSKAAAISEVNSFGGLSGAIAGDGTATLTIDLATVNTAIEIRDQRMRDIAFRVGEFPSADVSVKVDAAMLDAMAPGTLGEPQSYTASVSLHGVTKDVAAELQIVKLDADTVLVQLAKPLLVAAGDFGLAEGVEELRTIANLPSINPQVVVDFSLVYDRQ